MAQLAEAAFTHVDEIAAASVAAYAEAQADAADTLGRRRHRLLTLLVSPDPGAGAADAVRQAAREADWRLPATVAAVALDPAPREAPRGPPRSRPRTRRNGPRPIHATRARTRAGRA
ncbi:hypothetical protein NKH77_48470 [Streptomyces sp. M19]